MWQSSGIKPGVADLVLAFIPSDRLPIGELDELSHLVNPHTDYALRCISIVVPMVMIIIIN